MKNNRLFRILLLLILTFSIAGCSIFTSDKKDDQQKDVAKNTVVDKKEDDKEEKEDTEVIEEKEASDKVETKDVFVNTTIPAYSNSISRKNNYFNNSVIVKPNRKPIQAPNTIKQPSTSKDKVKPTVPSKPVVPSKPAQPVAPEVPSKKLNANADAKVHLDKSLANIVNTVSTESFGYGGEWYLLSLARSNYNVDPVIYDTYINNLVKKLKADDLNKDEVRLSQSTDNSKVIFALSALDKDVSNLEGYNFVLAYSDFKYAINPGINSAVYSLLALDTNNLEIPKNSDSSIQTTRANLIDNILSHQKFDEKNGYSGWTFWGDVPDTDMTAMAIQALAPYYNSNNDVKAAIDGGLSFLSKTQNENGGYTAWGSDNVYGAAQVIVALTELGIDPHNDEMFVKDGKSVLDFLLEYKSESGGFKTSPQGKIDLMATQQGTYALVAYDRYINDLSSLYDMSDVKK